MALFKSNPEKTLQRDIETAISGRDKLVARLADADVAVAERGATARQLALNDATDGDLERAKSACRAAKDRVVTFTAALAESERQIATLERERGELFDKKLRAETAAEVEVMAVDLETFAKALDPNSAEDNRNHRARYGEANLGCARLGTLRYREQSSVA